jgi:gamma-glutamylcyclotransferase (GGCT)/AIG2-like uncharacterized protein YtfP
LEKSPIRVIPIESAFVIEHKLFLKSKSNASYMFLLAKKTGKASDIVSGYLAEVTDEDLKKIDNYEGVNYIRRHVIAYKRDNTPVRAFIYIAKD